MPRNQRHKNIIEAEKAAGASPEFAERLAERLRRRAIVNHLVALRGARGFSQVDIARKLGCTQSKVSKLENSNDEDMKLGDLRAYAAAIGLDIGVLFAQKGMGCVGRIKAHACLIRAELDRMVEMARGDHAMSSGVANFHGEAAVNILNFIRGSLEQMTQYAGTLPDCPNNADEPDSIQIEMRVPPPQYSLAEKLAAI
jgi:transcriptional regulator with XRE-family HTH domain